MSVFWDIVIILFINKQWSLILIDVSCNWKQWPGSFEWVGSFYRKDTEENENVCQWQLRSFSDVYFLYFNFCFFFCVLRFDCIFHAHTINFPVYSRCQNLSLSLAWIAIATMRDSVNVFVCIWVTEHVHPYTNSIGRTCDVNGEIFSCNQMPKIAVFRLSQSPYWKWRSKSQSERHTNTTMYLTKIYSMREHLKIFPFHVNSK